MTKTNNTPEDGARVNAAEPEAILGEERNEKRKKKWK